MDDDVREGRPVTGHPAFDDVIAAVADPVRRYLARRTDPDTAEDVVSEVMIVCWRRLAQIPPPPESVPWAIGVARHCLANAERSRRRRTRLVSRIVALDPPGEAARLSGPSAPDGTGDRETALHRALAELRAPDAEVLRLWAWEQLAAAEIAVVLGVSANAAAVRLHRAKQRLRRQLDRTGTQP